MLGMKALEKGKARICIAEKTITLWGRAANYSTTSTGHIMIPLKNSYEFKEENTEQEPNDDQKHPKISEDKTDGQPAGVLTKKGASGGLLIGMMSTGQK